MLDEHPCSYPFGYQAENGTVYVSYERSRWNQPEILMARFTEEDVLAGEIVSGRAGLRLLVNKAGGRRAVIDGRERIIGGGIRFARSAPPC